MDGIHDMGGMDGFGSVYPEPNEPVFHEHWEGRVLALNRAMGASGTWTITAVQDCRPRAGEEHPSKKPYAPAALRARPCGRSRACAWTPRVSGRDGHGPRRGPTMALYGAFRQPRTLGSGCRPNGEGIHRGLRALSAGCLT